MTAPKFLALLASTGTLLSGCDRTPQSTGTSDDTHSSILLTGRVFNDQSKPLGAVIVKLRHGLISDTTSGDGVFSIEGDLSKIPDWARTVLDTLDYYRDGNLIHFAPVAEWIDTLPDVFLVQRDISGAINLGWSVISENGISTEMPTGAVPVGSASATVWNTHGDSVSFGLEWFPLSQRYSGFVWFPYSGGIDSFKIQVKAYDSLGRILGVSQKLAFTSRAGDIPMPSFFARNTVPVVTLKASDFLVKGQASKIFALVSNPYEYPTSIWWKIGSGIWTQGSSDTLLSIPADATERNVFIRCKVVRADSLFTMDSLKIPVTNQ